MTKYRKYNFNIHLNGCHRVKFNDKKQIYMFFSVLYKEVTAKYFRRLNDKCYDSL